LGKFVINEFAQNQSACYPTTCKGCYSVGGEKKYIFEKPVSLNLIGEMDKIFASGIDAIKIEGRQRGKSYVGNVAAAFRKAVDFYPNKIAPADLSEFMEGGEGTVGAYLREWC
jgi:putative protease